MTENSTKKHPTAKLGAPLVASLAAITAVFAITMVIIGYAALRDPDSVERTREIIRAAEASPSADSSGIDAGETHSETADESGH